jgi:hypothetical protein
MVASCWTGPGKLVAGYVCSIEGGVLRSSMGEREPFRRS